MGNVITVPDRVSSINYLLKNVFGGIKSNIEVYLFSSEIIDIYKEHARINWSSSTIAEKIYMIENYIINNNKNKKLVKLIHSDFSRILKIYINNDGFFYINNKENNPKYLEYKLSYNYLKYRYPKFYVKDRDFYGLIVERVVKGSMKTISPINSFVIKPEESSKSLADLLLNDQVFSDKLY
jgi:hypothetical protein